MTKASIETVTASVITLSMSDSEAGALLDLLSAHVAGKAVTDPELLGGILSELGNLERGSKLKRVQLQNKNVYTSFKGYTNCYAVLVKSEENENSTPDCDCCN